MATTHIVWPRRITTSTRFCRFVQSHVPLCFDIVPNPFAYCDKLLMTDFIRVLLHETRKSMKIVQTMGKDLTVTMICHMVCEIKENNFTWSPFHKCMTILSYQIPESLPLCKVNALPTHSSALWFSSYFCHLMVIYCERFSLCHDYSPSVLNESPVHILRFHF